MQKNNLTIWVLSVAVLFFSSSMSAMFKCCIFGRESDAESKILRDKKRTQPDKFQGALNAPQESYGALYNDVAGYFDKTDSIQVSALEKEVIALTESIREFQASEEEKNQTIMEQRNKIKELQGHLIMKTLALTRASESNSALKDQLHAALEDRATICKQAGISTGPVTSTNVPAQYMDITQDTYAFYDE